MLPVALGPSGEVIDMRHPVALLAIASAVRGYEIVTQINRILGPRNEVVDRTAVTPDSPIPIEARAVLQVHKCELDHAELHGRYFRASQ
jgi:hypothetical protein